jgi:DUF1680 family protein
VPTQIDHKEQAGGPVALGPGPFARLRTLPRAAVSSSGGFWPRQQRLNREISLARGYAMLERAGNLSMLAAAAARERRELDLVRFPPFLDTDVYKWLEAVAWAAPQGVPSDVAAAADETIDLIVRAQSPDGYLNSFYQVAFPELRWTDVAYSHEIYAAGHLIQAAVAWSRALDDRRLLDVAVRFADHIDEVFGPGRRLEPDGHPLVESALVELFRETGERRYLELARFFLDQRGRGLLGDNSGRWYYGGPAYFQDHVPVRDAPAFEGHAVRALYLVTGAVDDYLEEGDEALLEASERQWRDLVGGKLYITGGIGQRPETEGFGDPYELPPDSGYCETCAAIASVQWNWRLLLATGKARSAELMERTLYNGVLSGVSIDGRTFFYRNPLLSNGSHRRAEWHYVACCPPNVMRLVASVGHYAATSDDAGIQVHQYLDSTLEASLPGGRVRLEVASDLPWEGNVTLTLLETPEEAWTLSVRIPAWADGATVTVNDETPRPARTSSYLRLRRRWQAGDRVELSLPMAARFIEAHPRVEATRGQVALERGPLVYCYEACDQGPSVDLAAAAVDVEAPVSAAWRPRLAGGATSLRASGRAWRVARGGELYRPAGTGPAPAEQDVELVAVPYFLWANRRRGTMRVWLPRVPGRQAP